MKIVFDQTKSYKETAEGYTMQQDKCFLASCVKNNIVFFACLPTFKESLAACFELVQREQRRDI